MKGIILTLSVITMALSIQAKELKVLAIGNSFSICVGHYLPQIVNSSGKHRLTFANMFIGGWGLNLHEADLNKALENPEHRPYRVNIWKSDDLSCETFNGNLPEMIAREQWDIITLQHASQCSFNVLTFEPFLEHLIAYLRQAAPQAKIMFQQTWAYRCTDPRFNSAEGDFAGVDQLIMFNGIKNAYDTVSSRYGCEIIPSGQAVQNWRREAPEHVKSYTPEELAAFEYPDLPMQSGDVVGKYWWEKQNGKMVMVSDHIHLNDRGEYLQACVWYLKLFDGLVEDIKFVPENMGNDFAAFCQHCAAEAVVKD